MNKLKLKISGMHCASCAGNISGSLRKLSGVKSAEVNFANKICQVEYDENVISPEEIKKTIRETGYDIVEDEEDDKDKIGAEDKILKIKTVLALLFSIPLLLKMFWDWQVPGEFLGVSLTDWIQHDLAFIVVIIFGWQFHKNAYSAIRRFQANMDTLISLGTLSAYFYSAYAMFVGMHLYFESAAVITALILLGRFFEEKTKGKASVAMRKLLELGVKKARIIVNGKEEMKNTDQVEPGEVFLVKPGEKIALDGRVIEGVSNVDESMLSGESMAVAKEAGSTVYGATMNQDGVLKVEVVKKSGDTVLDQIIKTVEDAQNFKAPVQKLADKISSVFVPIAVLVATATFIFWFLATGNVGQSLIFAVSVLIISCPCALGIATPLAIMIGSSTGAKKGILIKNGESFERAKHNHAIIFDKTGTLTEGRPAVIGVFANEEMGKGEDIVVKVSASLAKNSGHPLSEAVAKYADEKSIETVAIDNFAEVPGQGVKGYCAQHKTALILGNRKMIKESGLNTDWADKVVAENIKTPATFLFVAHGEKVIGALMLADKERAGAKEAVEKIKSLGIVPYMISGDHRAVVEAAAKRVGIENFLAEVMPNEKQAEVKKLQASGKKVVFAGDGINDAPALAQADLGIAMASGTDIAKETGDIIIMRNEPVKIYEAIVLSQKTFITIKQNLFFAFLYNALAIPLAAAGLVNPMVAALAMSLSNITVVGNSLRIYNKFKKL